MFISIAVLFFVCFLEGSGLTIWCLFLACDSDATQGCGGLLKQKSNVSGVGFFMVLKV